MAPRRVRRAGAALAALVAVLLAAAGCAAGGNALSAGAPPAPSSSAPVLADPDEPTSSGVVAPDQGAEGARAGAIEACKVMMRSGMEFDRMPTAYPEAIDLAEQAAATDPQWTRLRDRFVTSRDSFALVSAGTNTDEQFTRFQTDLTALFEGCEEIGVELAQH